MARGVFHRVADFHRHEEMKSLIDERKVILVIQIGQNFERQLVDRTDRRRAGGRGRPELQHRRHRARLPRRHRRELQRRLAQRPQSGRRPRCNWPSAPGTIPTSITRWHMIPSLIGTLTLLQTLLLTAMSVAREREQGTFDQLAGDAVSARRDHGRQGVAVGADRHRAGHQHPAGGAALVPHSLRRARSSRSTRADPVPARGGGHRAAALGRRRGPCSRPCSIRSCS